MATRVLHWDPVPGQRLPMPVLRDDREAYDPRAVAEVLQWLDSVKPGFSARRPAHIIVRLHRPNGPGTPIKADVHYGQSADCAAAGDMVAGMVRFRTTTIEVCCEKKPIKARYRFLAAIDDSDLAWPKFIVGPCLGILPGAAGQEVVLAAQVEQVMVCR